MGNTWNYLCQYVCHHSRLNHGRWVRFLAIVYHVARLLHLRNILRHLPYMLAPRPLARQHWWKLQLPRWIRALWYSRRKATEAVVRLLKFIKSFMTVYKFLYPLLHHGRIAEQVRTSPRGRTNRLLFSLAMVQDLKFSVFWAPLLEFS